MIIANLEYVNIISDLNKVEGGMNDSLPTIPSVDIPSADQIQQAVGNIEQEVNDFIGGLFPNL